MPINHRQKLEHVRVDLTFWINAHKANAAGKVPISLRITVHSKRAEVSTGIRCLPEEWDKAAKRLVSVEWKEAKQQYERLRKPTTATKQLNTVLDDLEAKARLLASDLRTAAAPDKPFTAATLRAALLPEPSAPVPCALVLLSAAAQQQVNQFTRATYVTALNALRRFQLPATTLPLPELTPALVLTFTSWLGREVSSRAGAAYLTQLRALYGHAFPKADNPFSQSPSKLPPAPNRPRYVLTKAELASLRELPLTGREAVSRDVYLTQYYLHGSRVGVMLELTWAQVDWQQQRVKFKAEKNGPWHDVAIRPPLAAILAIYYPGPGATGFVFPILPTDFASQEPRRRFMLRKAGNTYVWRGLQRIGELLGLPGKLHPHTARHSLATHTVEKTKDYRLAKEFLGHSSIAITEKYIRPMLTTELDAGADTVYND
jgi:integrase/recombinase XerD